MDKKSTTYYYSPNNAILRTSSYYFNLMTLNILILRLILELFYLFNLFCRLINCLYYAK